MAEALVTDLIKLLVSTVARQVQQEIKLVVGVDKEAIKLEDNLRTVQAVLNDAEKRQVTEEAVKVWLEKLNNVCYEMEDVVDEWNTELIKSAIQKEEEEKNADSAPVLKMLIMLIKKYYEEGFDEEFDEDGVDEEFDEDEDQKEESNEDEVDEEEDDKALHDKKEDDEAEHL